MLATLSRSSRRRLRLLLPGEYGRPGAPARLSGPARPEGLTPQYGGARRRSGRGCGPVCGADRQPPPLPPAPWAPRPGVFQCRGRGSPGTRKSREPRPPPGAVLECPIPEAARGGTWESSASFCFGYRGEPEPARLIVPLSCTSIARGESGMEFVTQPVCFPLQNLLLSLKYAWTWIPGVSLSCARGVDPTFARTEPIQGVSEPVQDSSYLPCL